MTSPFTASVPQLFADVDRDKVLRQGVALGDVYQTMQAFLGGLFVNQFNRFGRQWRVFLQAEGDERTHARARSRSSTCATTPARWCRCRRCRRMQPTFGPQFTNRFNVYRAAQITGIGGAGLQLGPGDGGARGGGAADAAAGRSATTGRICPTRRSSAGGTTGLIFALSLVFVFLILAALYESWSLPFSVLLTVPVAVFGAFARPAAARASTSTSTRRSASSC